MMQEPTTRDEADRRADLLEGEAQALAARVRDLETRVALTYGRAAADNARRSAAHLDTLTALLHAI